MPRPLPPFSLSLYTEKLLYLQQTRARPRNDANLVLPLLFIRLFFLISGMKYPLTVREFHGCSRGVIPQHKLQTQRHAFELGRFLGEGFYSDDGRD